MKRGLGVVMALAILSLGLHGLIGGTVAQDATPTEEPVLIESSPMSETQCADASEYARLLVQIGAGLTVASSDLPTTAVSQWSDEIYTKFSGALTLAIEKLSNATPPIVAKLMNRYAIKALQATQSALEFARTSRILGRLPFADHLGQVSDIVNSLVALLEGSCPGITTDLGTPVTG